MYGWERRGGALADHFRESITDEDVARAIDRAKRALVPDRPPRDRDPPVVPSEATSPPPAPPAPPPPAPVLGSSDPPASPRETFLDAKAAGIAAFARGDHDVAAARFAEAAERLASSDAPDACPRSLAALHSNRSAALLRAGRPADALRAADDAAAADATWPKAHFRRGEALFAARASPKPPPRTRAPFATPTPTPTPIPPRILARPRNRNRRATPSW